MNISAEHLEELLAHVLEDPENECCGVVVVDPTAGRCAVRVHRATNIFASPLKFQIDPQELYGFWKQAEDSGLEIGAIYHSHVRSPPYPSQTDVTFAAKWPGVEWIIVGLAGGGEPEVRSYLIDGAQVSEIAVEENAS